VNPYLVDKKYTIRQAERLISIAGPVSNLILAFIACLVFAFLSKQIPLSPQEEGIAWLTPIYELSQRLITINLFLALFNLIPVPPLDGFSFFANLLPATSEISNFMIEHQQVFLIFIFVFAGQMLYPFVMQLASLFLNIAYLLVG
jgi:Zn-dependent protease